MTIERQEIPSLQFIEQELDAPPEHQDAFAQAQRLLARLLVRAWLEQRRERALDTSILPG